MKGKTRKGRRIKNKTAKRRVSKISKEQRKRAIDMKHMIFLKKKGGRLILLNTQTNKKYEISWKDDSYNRNTWVRESHNCYTYYLNKKSGEAFKLCKKDFSKYNMCRRPQPGYISGFPSLKEGDYNCPEIFKRTLADNPLIRRIKSINDKCNHDEYKGAIVVAPKYDYHYYRLNDENQWTHKPGYKPSTHLDADNNVIYDPEKANRKYNKRLNYSEFCGYTCVPRDPDKKQMSHKVNVNHKNFINNSRRSNNNNNINNNRTRRNNK